MVIMQLLVLSSYFPFKQFSRADHYDQIIMDKCWIHDVAKLKRLFLDIIQIWFADCGMSPKKVAYFASFQDIVEAKEYLQQKGVDVSSS